jgi:hypothetical protein
MSFASTDRLYWHQGNTPCTSRNWEVHTMAASIFVELESGTSAGRVHPHNGYYAGDFSTPRHEPAPAWKSPVPSFDSGLDLSISA